MKINEVEMRTKQEVMDIAVGEYDAAHDEAGMLWDNFEKETDEEKKEDLADIATQYQAYYFRQNILKHEGLGIQAIHYAKEDPSFRLQWEEMFKPDLDFSDWNDDNE